MEETCIFASESQVKKLLLREVKAFPSNKKEHSVKECIVSRVESTGSQTQMATEPDKGDKVPSEWNTKQV